MDKIEQQIDKLVANKWLPGLCLVLDPQGRWDTWMAWSPIFEREFWEMNLEAGWN